MKSSKTKAGTKLGYCRFGKHGPRKLYKLTAFGRTIGWACRGCVKEMTGVDPKGAE